MLCVYMCVFVLKLCISNVLLHLKGYDNYAYLNHLHFIAPFPFIFYIFFQCAFECVYMHVCACVNMCAITGRQCLYTSKRFLSPSDLPSHTPLSYLYLSLSFPSLFLTLSSSHCSAVSLLLISHTVFSPYFYVLWCAISKICSLSKLQ